MSFMQDNLAFACECCTPDIVIHTFLLVMSRHFYFDSCANLVANHVTGTVRVRPVTQRVLFRQRRPCDVTNSK